MMKMTTLLIALLMASAVEARPECYIFEGEGLPAGIRDLSIKANRGPLKGALFSVIARDSKHRYVAAADFVCNNGTRGISFCSQDDDLGSFLISWEGEVSLQATRFALVTEKMERVEFEKEIVLIGKKRACQKGHRIPAGQKKLKKAKSS
ncbi:MAG TPA: hypothetical protein PL182_03330 [Pseudobdellovibrionaceae bacterium]|nr:hypothetical protein [Pseudobdellovibrionaceae bacterium]